jgi:hypothetical protein
MDNTKRHAHLARVRADADRRCLEVLRRLWGGERDDDGAMTVRSTFARVAGELGCHRTTAIRTANRLRDAGAITYRTLTDDAGRQIATQFALRTPDGDAAQPRRVGAITHSPDADAPGSRTG